MRYGYRKAQMLRLCPKSIRWWQAAAPPFVMTLLGLFLAGLILPPACALLTAVLTIYAVVIVGAGVVEAISKRDAGLSSGLPCVNMRHST